MAERRSLVDAMEMTPAKLAFIKGEDTSIQATAAREPAGKAAKEKTIDLGSPREPDAAKPETTKDPKHRSSRRPSRRPSAEAPEVSDVLDQVLVPVTIRLPHRTAQALRRAYLEQRLKHAKPDTQQEIAEEALVDWLAGRGFFD